MNNKLIFNFVIFGLLSGCAVIFGMEELSFADYTDTDNGYRILSISKNKPTQLYGWRNVVLGGADCLPHGDEYKYHLGLCLSSEVSIDTTSIPKEKTTPCIFLSRENHGGNIFQQFKPNEFFYITIQKEGMESRVLKVIKQVTPVVTINFDSDNGSQKSGSNVTETQNNQTGQEKEELKHNLDKSILHKIFREDKNQNAGESSDYLSKVGTDQKKEKRSYFSILIGGSVLVTIVAILALYRMGRLPFSIS